MKASELATQLMEHPDFDVKFHHFDGITGLLSWEDIEVIDIGYSDGIVILGGTPD